jgi:hypothetical protein
MDVIGNGNLRMSYIYNSVWIAKSDLQVGFEGVLSIT